MKFIPERDYIGKKFGYLTLISELTPYVRGQKIPRKFLCMCKCGNEIIAGIKDLKSGNTQSCGCYQKKRAAETQTTHGYAATHSKTKEYGIWSHIRNRCNCPTDPAYFNYGGRGIKVCDRWESFSNFITDMGKRPSSKHSLERKDNDGNYSPENCIWDTRRNQSRNKRNNVWLSYNGVEMIKSDWAIEFGISSAMLTHYLKKESFQEIATRLINARGRPFRNPHEHLFAGEELRKQLESINSKFSAMA